jgi:hypothetical protein
VAIPHGDNPPPRLQHSSAVPMKCQRAFGRGRSSNSVAMVGATPNSWVSILK